MQSRCASQRRARPALGTLVEVAASGRAGRLAAAVADAFTALERTSRLMSFHDPASELAELNREAATRPVRVSADTFAVLEAALEFARASDGAFDPCVAPALVRLGFLPAGTAAPSASAARGWQHVRLLGGRRVGFARPLALDLGGIAKGYAVDQACAALERHGIRDYVVNAGGDLKVGARAREVHVRHPAHPGTLVRLGWIANAALATSARYYAERDSGTAACHPIIDPARGAPARYAGSLSVLAPSCMAADALTKVLAVGGARAAPVLAATAAEARVLDAAGRWRRWPAPARAA